MKCPQCGRVIEENSVFCEYCGKKIKKPKWPLFLALGIVVVGLVVFFMIQESDKKKEREEQCYNECCTANDYRTYLKRYPDGDYVSQATRNLNYLVQDSLNKETERKAEAEKQAFNKCTTAQECRDYLIDFPGGEHTGIVIKKLQAFINDSLESLQSVRISSFPYDTYYSGIIGSSGSMWIDVNGQGSYTYDCNGTNLTRNIKVKSYDSQTGRLLIESFDKKGKYIGEFDGFTMNSNTYSGTFTNYKGGQVGFHLEKINER